VADDRIDVASADDEAARRRAAAELTEANAQLRAAAEQTAEFVALTAHELRSPITAITGAAEILRTYWNDLDDAERQECLDSILRGGLRIRRLLDDLILVSRLEVRSFDFRLEDLPLLSILDEAAAEVSEQVSDVTVTCDEPLVVRADRARLCQIVTNLVVNGARHGRPPIEVDAVRCGDEVEIRVRDAGPGVPEDMVGRLFGKFVKGPAGGSGLGLFIVRELVAGQGGRTWYERDGGGRSCFGFSLPVVDA
jgi:signal transduction histidine kinase